MTPSEINTELLTAINAGPPPLARWAKQNTSRIRYLVEQSVNFFSAEHDLKSAILELNNAIADTDRYARAGQIRDAWHAWRRTDAPLNVLESRFVGGWPGKAEAIERARNVFLTHRKILEPLSPPSEDVKSGAEGPAFPIERFVRTYGLTYGSYPVSIAELKSRASTCGYPSHVTATIDASMLKRAGFTLREGPFIGEWVHPGTDYIVQQGRLLELNKLTDLGQELWRKRQPALWDKWMMEDLASDQYLTSEEGKRDAKILKDAKSKDEANYGRAMRREAKTQETKLSRDKHILSIPKPDREDWRNIPTTDPTRYEAIITDGLIAFLIGYTSRNNYQGILDTARRVGEHVVRALGKDSNKDMKKLKGTAGFYIDGSKRWEILFTGRTQRQAMSDGMAYTWIADAK